jgi:prevent-host-death family protein
MDRSSNGPFQALQIAEDIVPIAELKAHLSEKIRDLRGKRRPLVVTQNGKPTAVLLAPEDFDLLTSQARFVQAVQEGLSDVDHGRVVSDEDLSQRLDARFGKLSVSPKARPTKK